MSQAERVESPHELHNTKDVSMADSPRTPVGRIEKIEAGENFVVVTGWAASSDGSSLDGMLELEVDHVRHPVQGLYPRADLQARGISAEPCAFCVDVPLSAGAAHNFLIRLLVNGEPLFSSEKDHIRNRIFTPIGSFDRKDVERVSGWAFDPVLWYAELDATPIELVVGEFRLPVQPDVHRLDLPFSSARTGRPVGFRIDLATALESAHGHKALVELGKRGSVQLSMTSRGHTLISATLQFPRLPEPEPEPQPAPTLEVGEEGFIDYCGFSEGLGGWIFGGWIKTEALGEEGLSEGSVHLANRQLSGTAHFLPYPRPDVEGFGKGILVFVEKARLEPFQVSGLFIDGEKRRLLRNSASFRNLTEHDVVNAARDILRRVPESASSSFGQAISRPIFEGMDTLGKLSRPVFFEVDDVIVAGTEGVMLIGWMLDPGKVVQSVRVRSTCGPSNPLAERWLAVERPDIREAFGGQFGLNRADHGFHAYAALPGLDPKRLYIEVRLKNGEVAFKPLPAPKLSGRPAMMRCLSGMVLTADTVKYACSEVLGPPVVALNRRLIASQREPMVMSVGNLPERPRCSFIVPLYGRLDFMMYQMALMSEHGMGADELVYVLDQPERKSEFLALARSCFSRYGVPARLVMPPDNLGFAGASNAGMKASTGEYICFLNSDVMPKEPGWVDKLVAAMAADPKLGILGAQLLFEDGTVQHAGMAMKRLPTFGNMPFPYHPGKGRLPSSGTQVRPVLQVTGALMLMRRELALEIGGFDTDYVIGDFEDADLCMKVRARGFECAVHEGVRLYHLERQSQGSASNAWRQNLTLVNAWTFASRWESTLKNLPHSDELQSLQ